MTSKELREAIANVQQTRTILSNRLSSLTFIEEEMRKLAGIADWTPEQTRRWAELEANYVRLAKG
jgi:hypothetical protein